MMLILLGLDFDYSEESDIVSVVVKELALIKGVDVLTLHVPK